MYSQYIIMIKRLAFWCSTWNKTNSYWEKYIFTILEHYINNNVEKNLNSYSTHTHIHNICLCEIQHNRERKKASLKPTTQCKIIVCTITTDTPLGSLCVLSLFFFLKMCFRTSCQPYCWKQMPYFLSKTLNEER